MFIFAKIRCFQTNIDLSEISKSGREILQTIRLLNASRPQIMILAYNRTDKLWVLGSVSWMPFLYPGTEAKMEQKINLVSWESSNNKQFIFSCMVISWDSSLAGHICHQPAHLQNIVLLVRYFMVFKSFSVWVKKIDAFYKLRDVSIYIIFSIHRSTSMLISRP